MALVQIQNLVFPQQSSNFSDDITIEITFDAQQALPDGP